MMAIDQLRQKANRVLRGQWLKYGLRNISNNDNHEALERIYRISDPWNLDSPRDHVRFAVTNKLIEKHFGRVGSLLEIGSSEGIQSAYLRRLCDTLYGVDVSETAVERARKRVPDARFSVGDLSQQPWAGESKRFDLVVACEVLYYVSDVRATISLMNTLGRGCVVGFFSPEAHKLASIMEEMPNVQKDWSCHDHNTWLFAWWRNDER